MGGGYIWGYKAIMEVMLRVSQGSSVALSKLHSRLRA